jgi:hypothetical protein
MMTNQHPITPPPELVQQWWTEFERTEPDTDSLVFIATQAARWGADMELEECCEVLARELICDGKHVATDLRIIRRPKPPSLKEQALLAINTAVADDRLSAVVADVVRRALEQLDD